MHPPLFQIPPTCISERSHIKNIEGVLTFLGEGYVECGRIFLQIFIPLNQ